MITLKLTQSIFEIQNLINEATAKELNKIIRRRKAITLGKLKSQEWNNMFYKHLDHHLTQFGV